MKSMKCVLSIVLLLIVAGTAQAWQKLSYGILEAPVYSVAVHPTESGRILAGTQGALYQTRTEGELWKRVLSLDSPGSVIHTIYVDPKYPNLILVGSDEGLHRSLNGGKKWEKIFDRFDAAESRVLSVGFDSSAPALLLAGTGRGLFLSQDAGLTWQKQPVLQEHPVYEIRHSKIPGYTYLIANENGLYGLEQGRLTWNALYRGAAADSEVSSSGNAQAELETSAPLYGGRMSFFVDAERRIHLFHRRRILISEDAGRTWKSTGASSIGPLTSALAAYSDMAERFFIPTEQGIYFLNAETNAVQSLNSGLAERSIHATTYDSAKDTLYVATQSGLYRLRHPRAALYFNSWNSEKAVLAHDVLDLFDHEPTIQQLQIVAMRYAEVHPEKIMEWRSRASKSALFPKVSFGYDESADGTVELDRGGTKDPDRFILGPEETDTDLTVDVSWDLSELVWNPQQTSIDNRSKLMVQLRDDLLNQLNHLYYARRRIQIDLMINAQQDAYAILDKQLLIDEYTAGIDALTGGYFSKAVGPSLEVPAHKERGE